MIRIQAIVGLCIALLSWSATAAGFDCAKAVSFVEKAVCADKRLSELDDALASAYKETAANAADPASLKSGQLAWLKTRNACQDLDCLLALYKKRIRFLDTFSEKFTGVLVNGGGVDNMSLGIRTAGGRTVSGYCGRQCDGWFNVDRNEVSSLRRQYLDRPVRVTLVRQRNNGRIAGPADEDIVPMIVELAFTDK